MPARASHYTEALTTVVASGATRATVATLSFTNRINASYIVGGSWNLRRGILAENSFSQLLYLETAVTATVCNYTWAPQEEAAPPDSRCHFAMREITTPASAGTQQVRLQCAVCAADSWEEITNVRLFAIQTTANDAYGENDAERRIPGSTLGNGTWETVCSATFSAAAAPYVLMGAAAVRRSGAGKPQGLRILHQGTARGFQGYQQTAVPPAPPIGQGVPHTIADTMTFAAGSNSIELQVGCSGVDVTAYDARVAVLRADNFNAFTAVVSDATANTTLTTFVTAMASAVPLADGPRYAILSHTYDRSQSITASHMAEFLIDTVTASEQVWESSGTAASVRFGWVPQTSLTIISASAGTHELRFLFRSETAGVNVDLAMQRILILQVDVTGIGTPPGGGGFSPFWFYHHQTGLYA